ncbi:hypothetical protein ACSLVK_01170 [Photorhabdus tasmaniensis]|uniref:hypothetical protein n=1 Tax=Photorhabdus tasmaniensis TaxID=1004159 RepID=UPI0040427CD5
MEKSEKLELKVDYGLVFGPADAAVDFLRYASMLESSDIAQTVYRDMAAASGLTVNQLIEGVVENIGVVELRSLRQITAMLAIARIIESNFGCAQVYGGISLGELAALHMAEAASMEKIVKLLRQRHLPDTLVDEAIGFVFIPTGVDYSYYDSMDHISVSVDYGPVLDGVGRMIMVSGLRSTLESIRTSGPAEIQIVGRDEADQAYHSLFREPGQQRLCSFLERNPFNSPTTPVLTALPQCRKVNSSREAASAILFSETLPLSVPVLIESMEKWRLEKVYAVSSFLGMLKIHFGAPTNYCDDQWVASMFG